MCELSKFAVHNFILIQNSLNLLQKQNFDVYTKSPVKFTFTMVPSHGDSHMCGMKEKKELE